MRYLSARRNGLYGVWCVMLKASASVHSGGDGGRKDGRRRDGRRKSRDNRGYQRELLGTVLGLIGWHVVFLVRYLDRVSLTGFGIIIWIAMSEEMEVGRNMDVD